MSCIRKFLTVHRAAFTWIIFFLCSCSNSHDGEIISEISDFAGLTFSLNWGIDSTGRESTCQTVGVDTITITVSNPEGVPLLIDHILCSEGDITASGNFAGSDRQIAVEGHNALGTLIYSGIQTIDIDSGLNNDAGDIIMNNVFSVNVIPTADAGPDQRVRINSITILDGSGSSDPDGEYTAFAWSIKHKPSDSNAAITNNAAENPSFIPDVAGDYFIQLIVNDGIDYSESETVKIIAFIPQRPVPDTGQTYSATTVYGEDSDYVVNPLSYTDNGDGTVSDNITGLLWQKADDNIFRSWEQAESYCSDLVLGELDSWRLPTRKEQISIQKYAFEDEIPFIDETYFPDTNHRGYWSSTSYADPELFWYVWVHGYIYEKSDNSFLVRCVFGNNTDSMFYDNGNGTVTDLITGLMWQQDFLGYSEWEESITYCENLELAGYNDWRLPNIKELASIVDEAEFNPAVNQDCFPEHNGTFWSSSYNTASHSGGYKLRINLYNGVILQGSTGPNLAKCVR